MNEHPIEGLMKTAMQNIKEMVDVNTILGDPVETPDGNVIVPISKVTFGFAAGGSEFDTNQPKPKEKEKDRATQEAEANAFPFGGGSGAGITIHPVAFLVVGKDQTKLLPVESNVLIDRLLDTAPQLLDKIQSMLNSSRNQPEVH
ncbi:sporulation protein YtfJ [Hydrogenispora ethanolica]|uniref:Sporulation protein YtfJ n=1 Tax=Hydrogenispora ethanolica TaxID=1082276 RepID=A0A4R1RQ51_HYDET|nr:GerW family sporulation protein [Hydrogenispora ethanolica]TCL68523.1 sporulation protein YtfJ [Hydrogenispora ethanolica]